MKIRNTVNFGHLTRSIYVCHAPERRLRETVWTFRAAHVSQRRMDGSDERLLQRLPKHDGLNPATNRRTYAQEIRLARGLPLR